MVEQTPNPEKVTFSGKGEIYSYTIVREPPSGFEQFVPYVVALIKLEEGPLITAMLTDLDYAWEPFINEWGELALRKIYDIGIGDKVEMVTRKLKDDGDDERGLIIYGYKFRPIIKEEDNR